MQKEQSVYAAQAGDSMSRPYRIWDCLKHPAPLRHSLAVSFALLSLSAACNLPLALQPTVKPLPIADSYGRIGLATYIADGLHWRRLIPAGDELAQTRRRARRPQRVSISRNLSQAGEPE